MENYFIVFTINYATPHGRLLANMLDIEDRYDHIKGFATKSKLIAWYEENKDGLESYKMLKPIS